MQKRLSPWLIFGPLGSNPVLTLCAGSPLPRSDQTPTWALGALRRGRKAGRAAAAAVRELWGSRAGATARASVPLGAGSKGQTLEEKVTEQRHWENFKNHRVDGSEPKGGVQK